MSTIYKYGLHPYRGPWMPAGANVLAVGEQFGELVAWADVLPQASKVERLLVPVPTGDGPPEDGAYVGTVQQANGLVWHVYDRGEAPTSRAEGDRE